jgi:hypothetical protein
MSIEEKKCQLCEADPLGIIFSAPILHQCADFIANESLAGIICLRCKSVNGCRCAHCEQFTWRPHAARIVRAKPIFSYGSESKCHIQYLIPIILIRLLSYIKSTMTVLEFWGCALIAFGPPLAMFSLTVASDPIKVILLISSSFFWLLSFLTVAICWSFISLFCDYLIIGAYLAVLSQEVFRFLFHIVTKRAQIYLAKLLSSEELVSDPSGRNEILRNEDIMKFQNKFRMSYGKSTRLDCWLFDN